MTLRNRRFATLDFFGKPRDARFQLMGGERGNILAQLNLRHFLEAGQKIVAVHHRTHWR